jgi:acetoin utilization deacetylase AcuC-like enzyme
VSAGFDAHARDPLAGMRATERGFAAMCSSLRDLASECCGGKLVLVLEGGYDLEALAGSVRACLEIMTGGHDDFPQGGDYARNALARTRFALRGRWKL